MEIMYDNDKVGARYLEACSRPKSPDLSPLVRNK